MRARTDRKAPLITLKARSHEALLSATARKVASLQDIRPTENLMVVYRDNAATVFREPRPSVPSLGLHR